MVVIDDMYITSITKYSKFIRLLLIDIKFLIMVAYIIFEANVTYVTLKKAFKIQVNASNKPCSSLFAC